MTANSEIESLDDTGILRLTFSVGHSIQIIASHYFEIMLSEDAAHQMHSVGEGGGEIHKCAKRNWEHHARKYDLEN